MSEGSRVGHDPGLYARSFGDVYDEWYHDLDDAQTLVDSWTNRREPPARIVEFGGGTGRLAEPLHRAGFDVVSLDISAMMLTSTAAGVGRVAADMAQTPLRAGCADGVLIAYNTLFNLASHELQRRCVGEAARLLRAGGRLAVEAFIIADDPAEDRSTVGVSTRAHPGGDPAQLTILTAADPTDPDVILGTHIERHDGATVCRPWRISYQSPAQIDSCATTAGLTLTERHEDWAGTACGADANRHVSWYQKP